MPPTTAACMWVPPALIPLVSDMQDFATTQNEEILQEIQIARETGGIAEYNRNDIDGMLKDAFEKSQSYYTVTYTPADKKWDGGYRKINISLDRKGISLSHRTGYYAVDPPPPLTSVDDFTRALRRGASRHGCGVHSHPEEGGEEAASRLRS